MKQITDSHSDRISLPLSLSKPTNVSNAIVPLQPQPEKIIGEWERLIAQIRCINQMAVELEAKILELKAIASSINSQKNYLPGNNQPHQNICKYLTVSVPLVKQKSDESFILTTRKVDLFRAEREAAILAQKLRQQNNRKRLASQRHAKDRSLTDTDTKHFFPRILINKS